MLEIFGIMLLCNKNKANALARGRQPGGYVALTIGLWVGLEFIGALIGFSLELEAGAYVLAILFALTGGIISYLAAKNCKPGSYVLPANMMTQQIIQNAQPLTQPAQINIIRESSMVGAVVHWTFTLNGQNVGSLGNGQFMMVYTNQQQNILRATDAYGTEIAPYMFYAQSGGYTEVRFKANRFVFGGAEAAQPQSITPPEPQSQQAAFCHSCGAPLPQNTMFCMKCGAACHSVPQSALMPTMLPLQPQTTNPMRAIWTALILLGGWLVLLLLPGAVGWRVLFNSAAANLLTDILFGVGIFLLLQRGLKYKLIASGFLLLNVFMVTFNQAAYQIYNLRIGSLDDIFTYYRMLPNFMYVLIPVILAVGAALLMSYLWRSRPEKARVYGVGWITAGTLLLVDVIMTVINQSPYYGTDMLRGEVVAIGFINELVTAAAVGLSVMLSLGISRQEKRGLRLSTWAYVWCSLCCVSLLSTLIAMIAGETLTPLLLILMPASLTGYILLLCGKRGGFFTILIAISVYLVSSFVTSLQYILYGAPDQALILAASIIGAANPVITWFSIRRSWQDGGMLPASSMPLWSKQKNVKTFPKVTTIINLAIGALFLLFPFPFMIANGFVEGMLACILPGAVVTAFSIWGAVSLFGKNSVYHRWLDVLMQVLFWVLCGSFLLVVVMGVIGAS